MLVHSVLTAVSLVAPPHVIDAPGKGVRIEALTKQFSGGKLYVSESQVGSIAFGRDNLEMTRTLRYGPAFHDFLREHGEPVDQVDMAEWETPQRWIRLGRWTYVSGNLFGGLPEGRSWVKLKDWEGPSFWSGTADVLAPATLKTLLADATSRRGRVIRGSTPYRSLAAVSPSFRRYFEDLPSMAPHLRLTWALQLDSKGVIERFTSTAPLNRNEFIRADLTFSGWGSRAAIVAPPADQVIDERRLDDTLPGDPILRDRPVISK
ncbi:MULTISPECIES: hypothetical protein [Nonomuraea]|uniref:Uncharacterized protein n=1 Tax=Nonomuraea mangrovi TaxID=2316207 RepID=A0ABW4SSE2_9ACTN